MEGQEGLLAAADQGTLFLDEVGELPLPAQGSFLRALEQHRFRPVGEIREISSDFRLVAATNRNLDDMVDMDLFRSDLRFRLRGMHIHVPPLRRRLEDIPALAARFIESCCQHNGFPYKEAGQDVLDMLTTYSWPGNVRELRNVLVRARTLCRDNSIGVADLPPEVLRQNAAAPPASGRLEAVVKTSEAQAILSALDAHRWNVVRTASALGVSRASLYEKMRKLGIHRPADNH